MKTSTGVTIHRLANCEIDHSQATTDTPVAISSASPPSRQACQPRLATPTSNSMANEAAPPPAVACALPRASPVTTASTPGQRITVSPASSARQTQAQSQTSSEA